MLKTLYYNISGCVKNNNWITEKYTISRGIRQGCPISCLNFIIAVEMLAQKIRSEPKISGFNFHNKFIKINQLADDTTLFLQKKEIRIALKLVE